MNHSISNREIIKFGLTIACQVALTAIGFAVSAPTFGIAMAVGAVYSVAIFIFKNSIAKFLGHNSHDGECSGGVAQKLTGVQFPKEIAMICSTLIAIEHLLHHSHALHLPFSFSLAFTGICIGAFASFYVINFLKHGPCVAPEKQLGCGDFLRQKWRHIGTTTHQ